MDMTNNYSVQFYITGVNHGFQEVQGLVKLKEEGLDLEFEVSFLGLFNLGLRDLFLSFSDLEEISFKGGWFSSKVIIEANSMKVFEELPGAEPAVCKLKIKRKNKQEAERLVSRARMQLSEFKLDQMG